MIIGDSSDIAACFAREFGAPLVFAKKSKAINIDGDMFVAEAESFIHKNRNQVIVSEKRIGVIGKVFYGKNLYNRKNRPTAAVD